MKERNASASLSPATTKLVLLVAVVVVVVLVVVVVVLAAVVLVLVLVLVLVVAVLTQLQVLLRQLIQLLLLPQLPLFQQLLPDVLVNTRVDVNNEEERDRILILVFICIPLAHITQV